MTFLERVISALEEGRVSRAFPDHKPTSDDMLFSIDYNECCAVGREYWSVRSGMGFLFGRTIRLSRGSLDDIEMSRHERKQLTRAYDAAIAREKQIFKERVNVAKY